MKEFSYSDAVKALKTGDYDTMNEATLWRIYKHYQDVITKKGSFGIVTSWRSNPHEPNTREWHKWNEANNKNFRELKKLLRGWGYGFVELEGHWKECVDPNVEYEKCPDDKLVDAVEPSLFVPGMSYEHAVEVMRRYDQDGVVYAGPETGNKVAVIYKDGKKDILGKFTPGVVRTAWSSLKGKTFVFEGFFKRPTSWVEALAFNTRLED